eukprot:3738582-Rhodomonas_salina.1
MPSLSSPHILQQQLFASKTTPTTSLSLKTNQHTHTQTTQWRSAGPGDDDVHLVGGRVEHGPHRARCDPLALALRLRLPPRHLHLQPPLPARPTLLPPQHQPIASQANSMHGGDLVEGGERRRG